MKGIVFTELLEFVERHAGGKALEVLLAETGLASGGAYTSVGSYPHEEALKIVLAAAGLLDAPAGDLMRQFGRELFGRFVELYPQFFVGTADARTFLRGIQTHIHDEVIKLYPEARPPRIEILEDDGQLILDYSSHRPMALVALGLIEGCIDHFGEPLRVRMERNEPDGDSQARFWVERV